ncbi:MAG: SusC/RagA family TonB-linked outer membrane protein [Alistipes sp.]|nr:SusC/RagA family TonB-linked outer membrane protein [Alistipes sp.]
MVNVELEESHTAIDDVIIVAYGQTTKEAFTGSATQVKGDIIANGSKESVDKGLVGKMAGVRVASDNGDPGSFGMIQVRGVGSIAASTQPLYVVDGVVVSTDGGSAGYKSANFMSTLNPDDIEAVTVLKDAAAASLYGSRAANGVVIITTKRGSRGEAKVSYSGEFGVTNLANKKGLQMMDAEQFITYFKAAQDNSYGEGAGDYYASEFVRDYYDSYGLDSTGLGGVLSDPTGKTNTNWRDEIFRNAFSQNHQVSLTAGNNKASVYAGLGYNNTDGVVQGSNFERFSGRLNVDYQAKKWLRLSFRQMVAYTQSRGHSDQSDQAQGMGYASPLGMLTSLDPTAAVKNPDGSYNLYPGIGNVLSASSARNPHLSLNMDDHEFHKLSTMRSMSNFDINIKFCEQLQLSNVFGYDFTNTKETMWWSPQSMDGESLSGLSGVYTFYVKDLNNSTTLRYADTFNVDHHLSALVGFELSNHKYSYSYSGASNYASSSLPALSVGQTYGTGGYDNASSMLSFFASANYDYANRYYVSASFRRDGSSRLGRDNRWANFWSVSAAWRLGQEEFLKDNDLFYDFKLKASFGTNGNLPAGYYSHMGLYSLTGGYGSNPAMYWSNPENGKLGWEKSQNLNAGFEWNLYDRVTIGAEYYRKNTNSLLFDRPSSAVTGFDSYTTNIGRLLNDGVEVEISSANIRTRNFTWTTDFNFTWQRSIVKELPDGADINYGDGSMYLLREGESMYTFYLPEWAGVNPDNGYGQFWLDPSDHSKGVTNYYIEAGSGIMGKALPDFLGGMTNTFTYKNFDLSFLISYQFGGSLFDYLGYFTHSDGFRSWSTNQMADASDFWTPENRNAKYPIPFDASYEGDETDSATYRWDRFSSRIIKSSDNIRMREITFGYNIPFKRHIDKLRVYFKATNPFMIWSATPNIDPDVAINGYRTVDVPQTKSFILGVNIVF